MYDKLAAYEGKDNYVFISYSHKDTEKVMPIMAKLQELGCRIWYDEGIAPGSEWPEDIAQHLNRSAMVIAFISPNSMASMNCRREINFALSKQKPFLSVILEPTEMPLGMELQLSTQQSVIRYNYRTEAQFIDKICACPDLARCKQIPEVREEPQLRETATEKPFVPEELSEQPAPAPAEASAPEELHMPEQKSASKSGKNSAIAVAAIVLVIVMTILGIALGTAASKQNGEKTATEDTVLVRVQPPEDWTEVYCWAWSDEGNAFVQWPGEPMRKDGDWFIIEVPNWVTGINIVGEETQSGELIGDAGMDSWIVYRDGWWIAFHAEPTEQEIQSALEYWKNQ